MFELAVAACCCASESVGRRLRKALDWAGIIMAATSAGVWQAWYAMRWTRLVAGQVLMRPVGLTQSSGDGLNAMRPPG